MLQTVAETPRLIIRNWSKDDIEPYAAIIGGPEVMPFIGYGDAKPFSVSKNCVHFIR